MSDILKDATQRPWSGRLSSETLGVESDTGSCAWEFIGNGHNITAIAVTERHYLNSEFDANAKLIVKAVNSYEPMLEALELASKVCEGVLNYKDGIDKKLPSTVLAYAKILEALTKAKGEQS